jgi:hypothetical protein
MKLTLTPAELRNLQELVMVAQSLIDEDQEGTMVDLYELVEVAAEILEIKQEEQDDDDSLST